MGRILLLRRPALGSFSPDIGKLPWLILFYALFAVGFSIAVQGTAGGRVDFHLRVFAPFIGVALIAGLLQCVDTRQDGGRAWLVFTLLLLLLPAAGFFYAVARPILNGLISFDNAYGLLSGFPVRLVWLLPHFISVLPLVWFALAGTLFIARIGQGSSSWRRGLYVPLVGMSLFAVFTSTDTLVLWKVTFESAPKKEAPGLTLNESVFYAQPRILDERLSAIAPGNAGVPEIFFLGVAGSEEDVFKREAITFEELFKNRFGTSGHSLILVNNPDTAKELPFATRESLARALRRFGEQMNGNEDLLFLFLTSHGTEGSRFSIRLRPFNFLDITPDTLRKMLDESKIKRRVIVVSACYSGGFIPALADENTLVITSASADRSSFGCDDESELTEFGRAYFDEALRETRSFTEAFERAKTIIAQREKEDGLTPSQPMMAGGSALRAQLNGFARRGENGAGQ
jgi:hypothetical protein